MFIHEMTVDECSGALKEMRLGRLACARDNQPYIVPINFAFDGAYIYGFTTLGQKIEWTRTNPLVCFEVDEVVSHNEWMSIVVFGRYEELPDKPEYEKERIRAHACLQKRAMWWEPAYISQEHRKQPHSLTPIFFRIHIEKMTGHCATFDRSRADPTSAPAVRSHKRGWLKRLINH
jgi:nitroimidazol reductase NimA-like FMN-containing flavoprotein (pyridoxamine 5'-phosphate oxidase superfamily)